MKTKAFWQTIGLSLLYWMIQPVLLHGQSSCPDPDNYYISCNSGAACGSTGNGCSFDVVFRTNFNGNNKYANIQVRYKGSIIHNECVGPLPNGTTSYRVTVTNIDCDATTAELGGTWTAYTNSSRQNPCGGTVCDFGYCVSGVCASGLLPIELGSFDAKEVASGVMISWTTLSESNNDHFEVQRSKNGVEWETIGIQPGAIFSEAVLNYEFLDNRPYPGLNYYRLLQKDLDGNNTLSHMVQLEYFDQDDGIVVDMSERSLQIQASSEDVLELEIYDMQGQRFLHEQVAFGKNTDIRFLPAGIYAAVLKRTGGYISTHRFALP